jgi:hypothetical protein
MIRHAMACRYIKRMQERPRGRGEFLKEEGERARGGEGENDKRIKG